MTAPEVAGLVGAEAEACNPELATLPRELATLKDRASADVLRHVIVRMCAWAPLTVEQLATLLSKDHDYLRNEHLTPMVRDGQLGFRDPESAKHSHQAYVAPMDTEEQP